MWRVKSWRYRNATSSYPHILKGPKGKSMSMLCRYISPDIGAKYFRPSVCFIFYIQHIEKDLHESLLLVVIAISQKVIKKFDINSGNLVADIWIGIGFTFS